MQESENCNSTFSTDTLNIHHASVMCPEYQKTNDNNDIVSKVKTKKTQKYNKNKNGNSIRKRRRRRNRKNISKDNENKMLLDMIKPFKIIVHKLDIQTVNMHIKVEEDTCDESKFSFMVVP